MRRLLTLTLAMLTLCLAAQALTRHVPQDYSTIQAALDACVSYDSIIIEPGEYGGFFLDEGPSHLTILGSGAFSDFITILYRSVLNPIHSCVWVQHAVGWEMGNFVIRQRYPQDASGIELWDADSCWIHNIDVAEVQNSGGMGLIIGNSDNTLIERCLIRAGNYDVVSMWYGPFNTNLTLRNLTVSAHGNGIINRSQEPGLHIVNCLTFQNIGAGIHIQNWSPSYIIQYNDSWDNYGSNYLGFTPEATNLSLNPMLIGGTAWWAFMPTANSPLIDAGDPDSPPDPDGTRADIGCFFYNQTPPMVNLTIDVSPLNPPIVVPAEGDSFNFNVAALNSGPEQGFFSIWGGMRFPDGRWLTTLGPVNNLNPPVGVTISARRTQYIPGSYPPGQYSWVGYCALAYPGPVWDSSYFAFTKSTASGNGEWVAASTCTGELFTSETVTPALPQEMSLSASPNPFNPATAIRYKIQEARFASLKVYDTSGRLIATLVDGWREAGTHEVTFDGSKLASGIYLAKLQAGEFSEVQKLVLMK
jgi:hypothetical protein